MVENTIQESLLKLGYSQLWLDSGVLTNDILEEQIKDLYSGEDDNTEHYRYRALIKYINQHDSFDNKILNQLLQLLHNENDKIMTGSATLYLLRKSSLTNDQFDTVADFLQTFGSWTIKQIDKERQQRKEI